MVWGRNKPKSNEDVEHVRDEPRPDFSKPLPREILPKDLQAIVDQDDDDLDALYSQYSVDTTDTNYRYAGYANRIRTILTSAHRYVAYTSDVGESFRPVAHPWLVTSAYALSWTYILGDVSHEGYKAYLRNRRVLAPPTVAYKDATGNIETSSIIRGMATGNIDKPLKPSSDSSQSSREDQPEPWATTTIPLIEDYRMVMAKRAVFQSIASMALPAFTIHSVVKYSGKALRNAKSTLVRTWGPIGLGLSVVPALPYAFDEPVGEAVDYTFRGICRAVGGEDAIKPLPTPPIQRPKVKQEIKETMQQQYPEKKSGWFGFGKEKRE